MKALAEQISELDGIVFYGRVVGVRGLMVEIAGRRCTRCRSARVSLLRRRASLFLARSWDFLVGTRCSCPWRHSSVRRGCRAAVTTVAGAVRASAGWLGRVVNALGEPIDGEGALRLGP